MDIERFQNRAQAGALLAQRLGAYAGRAGVIVLALPRGGVPVGFAVADALGAPLDLMVVRKLGVPGHEEYAMGAIASGGEMLLNADVVDKLRIPAEAIDATARRELQELERREHRYRAGRPAPSLRDRTVILVDDGLATGATMQAAVQAARKAEPARIVVAVPVGAADTCERLRAVADEVVCVATPEPFYAVGLWYDDFAQTSDEEVERLLAQAARSG